MNSRKRRGRDARSRLQRFQGKGVVPGARLLAMLSSLLLVAPGAIHPCKSPRPPRGGPLPAARPPAGRSPWDEPSAQQLESRAADSGVAHEVTCFALGTYVDDDGTLSLTERG